MKYLTFIISLFCSHVFSQEIYSSQKSNVKFFSKAPLEDIESNNSQATSVLNASNNEIVFFVPINGFKFKKSLMQEHFNENYMESPKYPNATFKGKINEKINFKKDTVANITSTGKLTIHGVEKERTEKGKLTIKSGEISIESEFYVNLKEVKVEIPKIVVDNISKDILVKINFTYAPYKK